MKSGSSDTRLSSVSSIHRVDQIWIPKLTMWTLHCRRAPCGWESGHEHLKKIIGREGLRAAGIYSAFEVPMLIPHSDKRPGDIFAYLEWACLSTSCLTRLRWTSSSIFHAFQLVGGMQWRGLEGRLRLLSRRSAESSRTPGRLAAAEGGTSVPTLSLDLQPSGIDRLYFNLLHPERVYCIVSREALYSSCRASVTQPRCRSPPALSGHQLQHLVRPNACCRRLPISCPVCLLEYPVGWFEQFKHEAKCLQKVHKNHQERNRGPIHRSYGNASAPVYRTQSLRTGQRPNRGLMRQAYRDSSPKASYFSAQLSAAPTTADPQSLP
jgi:hypothetical protein